jgi:hypothetical protein
MRLVANGYEVAWAEAGIPALDNGSSYFNDHLYSLNEEAGDKPPIREVGRVLRLDRPMSAGTFTLRDCTIVAKGEVFSPGTRVHCDNVTFLGGRNGDNVSGLSTFVDCEFKNHSVFARGGLFLRCKWTGNIATRHSFSTWGTVNPLVMIGCTFDGTRRGLVFQSRFGSIRDSLFSDITIRGCQWGDNSSEPIVFEGPGETYNNWFNRIRIYDCSGDVTSWYTRVRDNQFMDFQCNGSGFRATEGFTNNSLTRSEFVGRGLWFQSGATLNHINAINLMNIVPGWRNHHFGTWEPGVREGEYQPKAAADICIGNVVWDIWDHNGRFVQ